MNPKSSNGWWTPIGRLALFFVVGAACGAEPVEPDPAPAVDRYSVTGSYELFAVNDSLVDVPLPSGGRIIRSVVVAAVPCTWVQGTGTDSLSVDPDGTVTLEADQRFEMVLTTHAQCWINGTVATITTGTSRIIGTYEALGLRGDSLSFSTGNETKLLGGYVSGTYGTLGNGIIKPRNVTIVVRQPFLTVDVALTYVVP